ncbi:MAG: hypothetical protein HUU50_23020 [Candidatus Brocadiae bacterium]|nr:hypothetical protein [Candidatus Brocadiia bacterium]
MNTEKSLESLLQTLVNSPEEDKRSLTRTAVSLLREVCNVHLNSSYIKFHSIAQATRSILDQILLGQIEGEAEEEFLESGDFASQTPEPEPGPLPDKTEQMSPFCELIQRWNSCIEPWLQITLPPAQGIQSVELFLKSTAALRSNLLSAASVARHFNKDDVKLFETYWGLWIQEIQRQGYDVFPDKFGRMENIYGKVIYSCKPRLTQEEIVLLMPGIKQENKTILEPVTLITLPPEAPFPQDHPNKDLSPQWRAILGELELLLFHLEIQSSVVCAIEGINKNRLDPLVQCKESIINEIRRRGDALRNAIKNRESIYRLATNYWRVEECFWSIFHNDERPAGYSFFSRIRRRVQTWHPVIRQIDQLYVRNFESGRDSIASINKYIGNIFLQTKQGVQPGTILRQLKPAVIVKVNNITRLLKGRVIAT